MSDAGNFFLAESLRGGCNGKTNAEQRIFPQKRMLFRDHPTCRLFDFPFNATMCGPFLDA
jgi:hypothetical protein